jgi:hypothetical protein
LCKQSPFVLEKHSKREKQNRNSVQCDTRTDRVRGNHVIKHGWDYEVSNMCCAKNPNKVAKNIETSKKKVEHNSAQCATRTDSVSGNHVIELGLEVEVATVPQRCRVVASLRLHFGSSHRATVAVLDVPGCWKNCGDERALQRSGMQQQLQCYLSPTIAMRAAADACAGMQPR